jgi:tetratricopeptide (TPR) repeat protein
MNTKIAKRTIISSLSIILLIITGCSDFLDTEQRGVTTQDAFYKTDAEATEALFAIYNKMQSNDLNTFQFKTLLSDDAMGGGGGRGDNSQGEEVDEFRFSSSNTIIRSMFTKYYQIIYTANLLIERVEVDTEVKKVAVAEAKTFRAYAYFELVTLWGTAPLVTHTLEPNEYAQPNSTIEELWAQIEKDLTEAIPDLPLKSQLSAAYKGNISKGTAQSWLGKAYLYQKKYNEAAVEFDKVIASGEYTLNPDFFTLTRKSSEFGSESIFEISYADELSTITEGNVVVAYCGPRTPWFKAGSSGITETGWGYSGPRKELYDAFVAVGDDIRKKGTVMSEEDLINDFGGSFRNSEGNLPYGTEGYIRLKHGGYVDETPGEEYHTISGMNFRITRYADVLLMAAEAYNRKPAPDDAKALSYINQVRERVQMPALFSTGEKLFEDIKLERRLELAFEFVRYQDLIRWGDAADVLADKGKRIPRGDGTYFELPDAGFKERHWLLPFPDTEMNVNPNLTQNPGW